MNRRAANHAGRGLEGAFQGGRFDRAHGDFVAVGPHAVAAAVGGTEDALVDFASSLGVALDVVS